MKEQLFAYIAKLLSEVQDPKTLLLRTLTMLVLIAGWTLIDNPDAVVRVMKDLTRESFIVSLEEERLAKAPLVSKERVGLIYGQTNADLVYVAVYQPKQQNDYMTIVAQEGQINQGFSSLRMVIRKNSKMYLSHLSSRNYAVTHETYQFSQLIYPGTLIRDSGVRYIYTCPIYSIDNILSGHIGIAFLTEPPDSKVDTLESICEPNARAVGRYL